MSWTPSPELTVVMRDRQFFGGNREKAIERDCGKCVRCGMTRAEHRLKYKRDITVDHQDNLGVHVPRAKRNNSLDNLQTLCLPCHGKKDNPPTKLTDIQVINVRHMRGAIQNVEIARLYGIHKTYVGYLFKGLWRKDVSER